MTEALAISIAQRISIMDGQNVPIGELFELMNEAVRAARFVHQLNEERRAHAVAAAAIANFNNNNP